MNSFNPAVPPSDGQIDQEVNDNILDSLSSEQGELLKYLLRAYRQEPPIEQDCFLVLMGFSSYMNGKATVYKKRPPNLKEHSKIAKEYDNGRTEASSLRHALRDYYRDRGIPANPSEAEIVRAIKEGLAKPAVHIAIPSGSPFGYKPSISWSYSPLKGQGSVPSSKAESPDALKRDSREVTCSYVGTNAEGISYLADRLPLATRIEDTVVRWNITDSLYEGEDFQGFKKALRESQAEFVVITGPMKDKAYVQAVKDVFGDPTKERQLDWYQLHHTAPIMNFIILKYAKEPSEVLFGWGTQHGDYTRAETKVFRSNDERVVKEFQRLFKVLQNKKFSSRINVTSPIFEQTHHEKSDVLATYHEIPRRFIREMMESAGCSVIRIGVTCSVEIERLSPTLKDALGRNVVVQILLSHPESDFLKLRGQTTSRKLAKLVRDNLEALCELMPHAQMEIKVTPDAMSVTHTQINDLIIFSPFWNGRAAADGYHFVVQATSGTGEFLEKQFNKLWADAKPVIRSASEIVIPPLLCS